MRNNNKNNQRQRNSQSPRSRVDLQTTRTRSYSYYHRQAENSSTEGLKAAAANQRSDRSAAKRFWFTAVILGMIILIILELPVSLPPKIIVQSAGKDTKSTSVKDYQQASSHILSEQSLVNTKLTLNGSDLSAKLKDEFPEIKSAELSYSLLHWQPTLKIATYPPALILENTSGDLLVSSNGVVVSKVDKSKYRNLPQVIDKSNLTVDSGQVILPKQYVSFIADLAERLKLHDLKAKEFVLPGASIEINAYIKGQSYYVKFNLKGDGREQVGSFLAAKRYLDGRGITVKQYIDARVPGRVYYK